MIQRADQPITLRLRDSHASVTLSELRSLREAGYSDELCRKVYESVQSHAEDIWHYAQNWNTKVWKEEKRPVAVTPALYRWIISRPVDPRWEIEQQLAEYGLADDYRTPEPDRTNRNEAILAIPLEEHSRWRCIQRFRYLCAVMDHRDQLVALVKNANPDYSSR